MVKGMVKAVVTHLPVVFFSTAPRGRVGKGSRSESFSWGRGLLSQFSVSLLTFGCFSFVRALSNAMNNNHKETFTDVEP